MKITINRINMELKWINRGRQRYAIFKIISHKNNLTTSQIHKKAKESNIKISLSYVSNILKEIKKEGLIAFVNKKKNKRGFYKLTKLGEQVRDKSFLNTNKIFAHTVKNLRQKKNLTQLDVANKANIKYGFYRNIENCETDVTLSTASKIANALGYNFGYNLKEIIVNE